MKKKTQSAPTKDSEKKLNLLLSIALVPVVLFSLYSGGEIFALVTLLILLAASYKAVRYSLSETHLEKLMLITVGAYLTLVSLIGFTLTLIGFNLSVRNFFILSILAFAALHHLTKGRTPCKVKIDGKRLLLIGGALLIPMAVYMWPSLPSFTSPCTAGFDCTLHMEYMDNIYSLEHVVPPVTDWRYYPSGFHINGAFLAHALEPDMPSYSNLSYPFAAFISAMIVAIMAGMAYDRLKKKRYVALFIAAILSTVYPASALIGYGFWSHVMGMYYVALFAWTLSDFVERPGDRKILLLLLSIAAASIIAYQLLTSAVVAVSFAICSLSLAKAPLKKRIATTLAFLAILGGFYALYTLEGYSRYLRYSDAPVSTYSFFQNQTPEGVGLNKGTLDIQLNNTKFYIKGTGLHVEELYVDQGVKPLELLSKGLDTKKMGDYTAVGRNNISGPSGAVLFYNIIWFGLLTILLMAAGILYSHGKREYTLAFMEASIIHVFIFYVGMKTGMINEYYYSKMMYILVYPMTLYAVVGVEELFSRMDAIKKSVAAYALVMLVLLSLSLNLLSSENMTLLFGEKESLYKSGEHWALLEYNRFLRYWDLSWGIKRDAYGLLGWLNMLGIESVPILEDQEYSNRVRFGVWNATSDFAHELGFEAADGSWQSTEGGFGYMIGANYIEIPRGSYVVSFTVKVNDNKVEDGKKAVTIEVARDRGAPVVVRDLYPKDFEQSNVYQDFNLPLMARETLYDAEFRAHYDHGTVTVTIEKVTMRPLEE